MKLKLSTAIGYNLSDKSTQLEAVKTLAPCLIATIQIDLLQGLSQLNLAPQVNFQINSFEIKFMSFFFKFKSNHLKHLLISVKKIIKRKLKCGIMHSKLKN